MCLLAVKKSVYKSSEFKITNLIIENEAWSPEEIKDRAQEIANFVVRRWPIF